MIYFDLQENVTTSDVMTLNDENENMIRRLTLFFVPISFAIILIIGLIGNILVIVVVSYTIIQYTSYVDMYCIYISNNICTKV